MSIDTMFQDMCTQIINMAKSEISADKITYTTEELCNLFHTTERNINSLRTNGLLPAVRIGKGYIYSKKAIETFLDKYSGYELTNDQNMKEAFMDLKSKKRWA